MNTNFYAKDCHYCGQHVPAETGMYDCGTVSCTEIIYTLDMRSTYYCLVSYNQNHNTDFATRDDAQTAENAKHDTGIATMREEMRLALVNGELADYAARANVKSLAQVITKVTGAEIAIDALTFDQICDVRNELQTRINRKNNAKALDEWKQNDQCNRCGGAGRADKWAHTGSVCYQCGGSGKYYNKASK